MCSISQFVFVFVCVFVLVDLKFNLAQDNVSKAVDCVRAPNSQYPESRDPLNLKPPQLPVTSLTNQQQKYVTSVTFQLHKPEL